MEEEEEEEFSSGDEDDESDAVEDDELRLFVDIIVARRTHPQSEPLQ